MSPTGAARTALVLNAGSRTIKASVVDARGRTLATIEDDRSDHPRDTDDRRVVEALLAAVRRDQPEPDVVGHRIVHGGPSFRGPVLVDDRVLRQLDELSALAPLHNPVAVAVIRSARDLLPAVPHVACFDTAFHATLPEVAWRYPLPDAWLTDWGIRRYGFHGLSVEWSIGQAAELMGRTSRSLDLVVAHLGGGCSVTAVRGGRSVWTSMGLTPLEGLMMATRSGSIDPGALVAALRHGLTPDALEETLDRSSGLLAVAGTGNARAIEDRARGGDAAARLAIDMFVDRAAAEVAAAATRLRRLDAVVFTGGIGEHSAGIRRAITARVAGIAARRPRAIVVEAREDLVIARAAIRLTTRRPAGARDHGVRRDRRHSNG